MGILPGLPGIDNTRRNLLYPVCTAYINCPQYNRSYHFSLHTRFFDHSTFLVDCETDILYRADKSASLFHLLDHFLSSTVDSSCLPTLHLRSHAYRNRTP
jgi:hypothetical protein